MKNFIKGLLCIGFLGAFSLTSCSDWLDKTPDSTVSSDDAFKNFTNFQGYVEVLYNCIPDFGNGYWSNSFNWGEDEIMSTGVTYHYGYKIDGGDFWGWQKKHDGWGSGWMDRTSSSKTAAQQATSTDRMDKSLWPLAWWGIREANIGLANLDKMTGTDEEKNLIAGQLYFFRGWFYFELMQYFGGLPYIKYVLAADQQFTLPRLNYQQTADSAAVDLTKAASLLPINWDNTTAGANTSGNNQLRINKIMALGYLGKDLLWAGSPLMNKESTGNATYNTTYCQKAAEAFGQLLNSVESGETQYSLVSFSNYSSIFYSYQQSWKLPGSTEAIFRGPVYSANGTNWGLSKQYTPQIVGESSIGCSPTANYVNYYGMANGLPLDDPNSGFDSTHPWKGRDPRFYHDIVYDGMKFVQGTMSSSSVASDRYANLYSGGSYRDVSSGSRTGYVLQKFIPNTANTYDQGWGYGNALTIHIPWMRLGDIYLMYAEAAAEGYSSPASKSSNFSKTAVQAVNVIRDRAGVGKMATEHTTSLDGFMSELRRERAVELAYEGHRFNDLRRWLLLTVYPYTIKTSQEFIRTGTFNATDSKENAVSNFRETTILTRPFTSDKYYWLPLKVEDVQLYKGFDQNPGW